MPEAVLAPGARIECRSAEWLVRGLGRSSDGQQVVDVVGVSPFLREKEARFLVEVERAAGSFKVLQPEDTDLVCDPSPRYRDSLLFIEAHLRRSVPTDASLVVGHRAAMDANARPQRQASSGDQLFEELFGISADTAESGGNCSGDGSGDRPAPAGISTPVVEAHTRQSFSLFPSLWGYVDTALDAVAQQMERRGEKFDLRVFPEQQRLEITPPSDLQRRYDRYPRELQPPRGQRLALSSQPAALQRALEQSRRQDNSRPELEYLWDLHPLVDWLADRGQITFPRHHAPVLQLTDGLDPGAVVMVFQGTIPNQKGVPVVQEWVAVRFAGTGLKVVAVEPFEAVATRLQLGSRDLANISGEEPPEHLAKQLPFAVEQAISYLRDCAEQWTARVQPELEAQRERLRRLRGRQVEQLELSLAGNQRPQQIKDKQRQEKQKAIDGRFLDHERFVSEVMTIDPAPYLKLVAVLHRDSS